MRFVVVLFIVFMAVDCAKAEANKEADTTPLISKLQERLDAFPLPSGENVKRDIDFDQQPDFDFIHTHQDLTDADPFAEERREGKPIPVHAFEYFLSDKTPREIYIFYNHYIKVDQRKLKGQQALPVGQFVLHCAFDEVNEGDVPWNSDSTNAVYYKIDASNWKGRAVVCISIFNRGKVGKTLVYLTSYNRPKE